MLPIYVYLLTIFVLLIIGLYCMTFKNNMIRILLGLEIVLNAANIGFIIFSSRLINRVDILGQSIAILSIALGGCVIAVGLSIVLYAYKHYKTLNIRELKRLKW